ncbi:unnamed protein product [Rotaria socialis]|uniref:Uncharacterized protein n=1 Tax=Rotaria socialis TaxID=392032 RepID=A0A820R6V5_9BILA|nr:unnamed protein product [Rotaria socialis]CAF4430542.1 unnamed protein product [Rotaria socialis]CAF4629568.1 unnamed protein product [Rotaria socialis]CAF4841244.1 unnamed protein product [Rotaria socialis]
MVHPYKPQSSWPLNPDYHARGSDRGMSMFIATNLNLHQKRHRSIDKSNVSNILQLNESLEITYSKFIENLNYTNQYLLALSKIDDLIGSLSVTSDRNHSKNLALANHLESSEDDKSKPTKKNIILSPIRGGTGKISINRSCPAG